MRAGWRALAVVGCVPVIWACGCAECPETHVSLAQLVREHNANAAAVPRLWARVRMELTLVDDKGQTFTWSSATPNGLLVLAKTVGRPDRPDFALIGREAGQELFRVGSSAREGVYYCWYRFGGKGLALWGRQKCAGAAGMKALPIDPYQLLAVLGVCELPAEAAKLPAVVLAMSRRPCAYVVSHVDRDPVSGRILLRRETILPWSREGPRRASCVNFFSHEGNRVMTATMKDYRPIERPDADKATLAPVMPTDITLESAGRGEGPIRRIRMVLSNMTTADKWDRSVVEFQSNLPPGVPKFQIDGHLAPGSQRR